MVRQQLHMVKRKATQCQESIKVCATEKDNNFNNSKEEMQTHTLLNTLNNCANIFFIFSKIT